MRVRVMIEVRVKVMVQDRLRSRVRGAQGKPIGPWRHSILVVRVMVVRR